MQSLNDELDAHFAMAGAMRGRLPHVIRIADAIWDKLAAGGTLFAFGNGGSASEALHFTGELVGRYKAERRPLAAHALVADVAALTCIGNDYSFEQVFARQVDGLAGSGDVAVGFTTSGRSANVIAGLEAARALGALTIMFTGEQGAPTADAFDLAFVSPSETTARIQEMHQLAMHLICACIDERAIQSQQEGSL